MGFRHIGLRTTGLVATLAALAVPGNAVVSGQSAADTGTTYTALAVDYRPMGGATATVDIVVRRWSTAEERQELTSTLRDKGAEALRDVVGDLPEVGEITMPGSVGYPLRYARRTTEGGVTRIVVLTDRPIDLWPSSTTYPFTMAEFRMPADGTGEGRLSLATRITFNPRTDGLMLENWDTQPVLLTSVRRVESGE